MTETVDIQQKNDPATRLHAALDLARLNKIKANAERMRRCAPGEASVLALEIQDAASFLKIRTPELRAEAAECITANIREVVGYAKRLKTLIIFHPDLGQALYAGQNSR